ncbi:unnamed protein product, partial [Iphiclides podalirius]
MGFQWRAGNHFFFRLTAPAAVLPPARRVSSTMAALSDVCAGLAQHKATLLRELCDTNLLDVLVKKGLFSVNDLELITSAVDADKCNYFIEVVAKQSGGKLQELCAVLNKECPKLSKELMNDRQRYIINGYSVTNGAKDNMVMNHNLNRRGIFGRRPKRRPVDTDAAAATRLPAWTDAYESKFSAGEPLSSTTRQASDYAM